MNEFELIHALSQKLPMNDQTVVGVGDDCAVLDIGLAKQWLLYKTDAVVEGVHFLKDEVPQRVGHKALARCMSDIAAMAGTPTFALVTLGLPDNFKPDWVLGMYDGINELARRHGVAVVGGETVRNPERVFVSVSLLGSVERNKCIRRSGAQVGDAIFVTGELGGSIEGKHLDFQPRLLEARWLAGHFDLHAMIDLSDGLAGDLRHVLTASKSGAELLADALPISVSARQRSASGKTQKTPLVAAMTDGEDFELLFTLPARQAVPLLDAWKTEFPQLKLSCVGRITSEPGLKMRERERLLEVPEHGYVHFS